MPGLPMKFTNHYINNIILIKDQKIEKLDDGGYRFNDEEYESFVDAVHAVSEFCKMRNRSFQTVVDELFEDL